MFSSHIKKLSVIFLSFSLSTLSIYADEETTAVQTESETKESEEIPSPQEDDSTLKTITFNAVTFLQDVLEDRYPLRIDFGAEPHRHGSLVFGSIWYDWNKILSSSIRGEYDHYMTFTNTNETVSTSEVRSVTLTPFPLVLFFGNPDVKAKSVFTEIDFGFYLQQSDTSINEGFYLDYPQKGFQFSETNSKYFMLGPAFNIVLKIPIVRYIDSISEFYCVPIYALSYDSNSTMHDTESSTHTSTSGLDFSSPYLRYSLCLDFFRYIRIKSQITYQHITMSQSDAEVDENLNISTHKLVLRYGGELLHPSKTRKKSSHLWGGLYYEMTWDWVYSSIGTEKTSTGKWVLCFGT